MSEILSPQPTSPLESLLTERGQATDGLVKDHTIPFLDSGTYWRTNQFYGVEGRLVDGGVGRLVVRQVEQLPDLYTATHPESQSGRTFPEYQQRGILADVTVRSIGIGHILVAHSALLQTVSHHGAGYSSYSKKTMLGIVKIPAKLLAFDPSGMEITRELEESEIDYTLPSQLDIIRHGLARAGRRAL